MGVGAELGAVGFTGFVWLLVAGGGGMAMLPAYGRRSASCDNTWSTTWKVTRPTTDRLDQGVARPGLIPGCAPRAGRRTVGQCPFAHAHPAHVPGETASRAERHFLVRRVAAVSPDAHDAARIVHRLIERTTSAGLSSGGTRTGPRAWAQAAHPRCGRGVAARGSLPGSVGGGGAPGPRRGGDSIERSTRGTMPRHWTSCRMPVADRTCVPRKSCRAGMASSGPASPDLLPGEHRSWRRPQGQRPPRLKVTASKGRMQTGSASFALAISTHCPPRSSSASSVRSAGSTSHRCSTPSRA